MARTYEEMMARMDELEKAQAATTAAPIPVAPVARVPAALKPAVAPGMEALPKPSAAPPAPTVTRRAVSVTPKAEEIKAPKPPEVEAPKPVGLTPDLAKPIDYKKFYDSATSPFLDASITLAAPKLGVSDAELKRIAQAQGVDLEAIFKARQKGRTYEEIAKAGRERGVIGFMPVAEREQAFNKLAQDVEKAQRGDAGDTIELVRSGADRGFGPAGAMAGYTVMGTWTELPEVAKPGEHGYAVAQLLVEALQKDPSAVTAYDLYGRAIATGNTQRYIDQRVEDLRKRANIKVNDPGAMEKMAALRKRAINEVIAYKTVGQWTPAVTLGDVEVREGRASPGVLDALKPNIEIIGFNNKRQAIFRQESPMGVLFRAIDIPQSAVTAGLSGQTVGQGVQSGANLLEYSLDATKDSAAYVKAPVVATSLVASILFPDAILGAGEAVKAVKAASRTIKARKIAPEAVALLETIARARKAGDYETAAAAEKTLRNAMPDVASNLDSSDAAVARFQKLAEPQSDILETDLAALIANAAPEQAKVFAGRPFLHPSDRKAVTGPASIEQADYAELYDTRRLLDRVQKAKTEYVNARKSGRSLSQYAKEYVRGRVLDVFENLPAERQLSAAQVTRMADLISAQAPTALLDQKQFKAAVEGALKADKEFGTDAYKMARQDAYKAIGGRTETKIAEMRGKTIEEIEAADIGLFDRAIKAIEQNNTARGVAAQLLRDEIAGAARLRVEPLELFDEVAPKLKTGEPIRLTSGGLLLLHNLRQAFPEQDFKEAYATITIIDKMIEGAAKSREVSPFALYQEIFPAIRRGTPEDLKRLAGELKAGKVPTGGAPAGGAPTAPAAPTKAAIARAKLKLREMVLRLGDEELDEIEALLRADGVKEGEAYALDAIKREKQRRAREAKKVAAATPAAAPVADAERSAQLQDELAQAVESGDEFRQGELEMEIENLRRTAQPEEVPAPAAVEEVAEAPAAAPTVEAPPAAAATAPAGLVSAQRTDFKSVDEFKQAVIDAGGAGFVTKQGSVYQQVGPLTQRFKTPHIEHDPKDVGLKKPSKRTIYLRAKLEGGGPDRLRETGVGVSNASTRWLIDDTTNRAYLVSRVKDGPVKEYRFDALRKDADGKTIPFVEFDTQPFMGAVVLELFDDAAPVPTMVGKDKVADLPGHKSFHPGNQITEMFGPVAAAPPTPAPIVAAAEAQPEAAKIVEAPAPAVTKIPPAPRVDPVKEAEDLLRAAEETLKQAQAQASQAARNAALTNGAEQEARIAFDRAHQKALALKEKDATRLALAKAVDAKEAAIRAERAAKKALEDATTDLRRRRERLLDAQSNARAAAQRAAPAPRVEATTPTVAASAAAPTAKAPTPPPAVATAPLSPEDVQRVVDEITARIQSGELSIAEAMEEARRLGVSDSTPVPMPKEEIAPPTPTTRFAPMEIRIGGQRLPVSGETVEAREQQLLEYLRGGQEPTIRPSAAGARAVAAPTPTVSAPAVPVVVPAAAEDLIKNTSFRRDASKNGFTDKLTGSSKAMTHPDYPGLVFKVGAKEVPFAEKYPGLVTAGVQITDKSGEAIGVMERVRPLSSVTADDFIAAFRREFPEIPEETVRGFLPTADDPLGSMGELFDYPLALSTAKTPEEVLDLMLRWVPPTTRKGVEIKPGEWRLAFDPDAVIDAITLLRNNEKFARIADATRAESALWSDIFRVDNMGIDDQGRLKILDFESQPTAFTGPITDPPKKAPPPPVDDPNIRDAVDRILQAAQRPAKVPKPEAALGAEAAPTTILRSVEPLARSAKSPWGNTPKRFVVAAESRLRKAAEDLDARRIDQVEYDIAVGDVKRDLAAQRVERAVKKSQAQLMRGADDARAKLLQAKSAGVIDEAGADLAEWLIRQSPRIADDLNIAVLTSESAKKRFGVQIGEEVAGFYEPVDRVVALIKERGSELTATHEILHHTEQMLPAALQTAVVDEWAKQIQKALRTATPEQRPALEKALTGDATALLTGVTGGTLPRSFYQYSNPSEFWAVNASRIVSGRYAAVDKGLVAKAKQWLTEFVEKVKSAFGLTSDAPIIRGLDDVLKGNGTAVSNMLSEGDIYRAAEATEAQRAYEEGKAFARAEVARLVAAGEDGVRASRIVRETLPARLAEFSDRELGIRDALSFYVSDEAKSRGLVPSRRRSAARRVKVEEHPDFIAAKDVQFKALDDLTAARRRAKEEGYDPFGYTQPKYVDDAEDAYRKAKDAAADVSSRLYARAGRSGTVEIAPDAPRALPSATEPQAPMPSGIPAAAERQTDVLKQVSPSGEVKGTVEWLEDGSSIIYLFEGADASTVLHEVAHVVRRNLLSNEDMGFIASWVQGMGVSVGHQYGEFTGDVAEIEKAEELFAKAFEQYVAEGKAPAGLEGAFAQLKDAVANVYKAVKDPVIGVELQPEVRRVFDGLFATEPTQADQSLKEAVRRGILGGPEAEVDILTVLSREAKRKGLGALDVDTLATRVNEAKANIKQILGRDPKGTDVVLKFDTKVLGKDKWTLDDLAAAQAVREKRLFPQAEARMALLRDLTGKGRGKAAVYKEDNAVDALWTALSDKETDALMTKQAKKVLRGVSTMFFGGNVLDELVGQTKLAGQPPAFRRAMDTSARIVEQSLADTVALVNDAVDMKDDTQLLRYLTGDFDVVKVSGRPILSSGHDKMGAVNRMVQRAVSAFSEEEKEALILMADAINIKDPAARGERLVALGFVMREGEKFTEADEARKATSDALYSAIGKLLYPQKQDADIGTALAAALRDAVNAPEKARPSHEFRLVETLSYIGGVTARDGELFKGDSKDMVRTLLGDIRNIYGENGEEYARRVAVQIGAFGGADQAKQFLVRMNLGVDKDTQAAFARLLNSEQVGAENIDGVERMLNTFGRDVDFVPDAALDVDFYIPRAARDRMAQVLARAQFRTGEAVGAADALATGYRYMKTRMTRGNFFIKQRYFMMNTVDHFNAMAYTEGFGVAAASTARVIAQDLVITPGVREILEVGKATGILSPAATEKLRAALQKLGDRGAARIGKMMSVSKYRIEVNPILEGVDGGFTVGGKVYRYRDIRDIAVEEGVFSSFDTRELQRAILREGQLVLAGSAAKKATVASPTIKGVVNNGLSSLESSVADIAEAWSERERLGAMVTLMEAGYDPRTAAQITIKALFDYSQSMTKLDRHWLVGMLLPFWAFQKNANRQVFNTLFSPWAAYRMMAVKRARERTSDLLTHVLYNTVADDYGVDVESMSPEMQDNYYSIIKAFEEAYGPDGPPEDHKRAMRMLLSGRAVDVEGGVYQEASAEIQRLRMVGSFADLAKFAPYTIAAPSKAARSAYMRDRTGFAVPFPRTEGVRAYNALLGDNHSYMELYWPDSTIEAGMKWHTQVAATMFLLAAKGASSTGFTDLEDGGIDEVGWMSVVKPIVDAERSPLLSPFLAEKFTRPPPKRIAEVATPEGVKQVHPMLGKMMDDLYGTTFLRLPAVVDPFVVNEDGTLPTLTPEQTAEIRRLQEQYPDVGVLKKQRYYIPGGVWATAFENSPLGELNSLLIRLEDEPLESQGRQTIQGEILIWARKYAGVDVTLTAPSQAVKREEPKKKTTTAGTQTF